MKQEISIERLFSLGSFKNIKLVDTISEIPKELIFNTEFQSRVRNLQFVRVHKNYFNYLEQAKNVLNMNYEEAMELLNGLETETITAITELLPNGKTTEDITTLDK